MRPIQNERSDTPKVDGPSNVDISMNGPKYTTVHFRLDPLK